MSMVMNCPIMVKDETINTINMDSGMSTEAARLLSSEFEPHPKECVGEYGKMRSLRSIKVSDGQFVRSHGVQKM